MKIDGTALVVLFLAVVLGVAIIDRRKKRIEELSSPANDMMDLRTTPKEPTSLEEAANQLMGQWNSGHPKPLSL